MDELMDGKDAVHVAGVKAYVVTRAEKVLRGKYVAIALYGIVAVGLLLLSVLAAYSAFSSVFRYNLVLQSQRPLTGGDNVEDPGDDNEAGGWLSDSEVRRTPSGNQIRNRIVTYSKGAGRDLKLDLRKDGDDYPRPPPVDEEEDDD
jgi:hypothetical protein